MAREPKVSMVEHRVTVAVRYPLDGGVPSIAMTANALKDGLNLVLDGDDTDEPAEVEILKAEAKHIRVPVNGAEPTDG